MQPFRLRNLVVLAALVCTGAAIKCYVGEEGKHNSTDCKGSCERNTTFQEKTSVLLGCEPVRQADGCHNKTVEGVRTEVCYCNKDNCNATSAAATTTTTSPTTASNTTESPTTASPTTASNTTASPTTASPTTASNTTASPTTASPTTTSPSSSPCLSSPLLIPLLFSFVIPLICWQRGP